MAVQDDVAALEFSTRTALRPEQIRAAGARAARAGHRHLRTSIEESFANGSSARYVATGPGLRRQMAMLVTWQQNAGRHRVELVVEEYQVEQFTVLSVPMGRRTLPALGAARRFVAALRAELAGHPAVQLPRPRPRTRTVPPARL